MIELLPTEHAPGLSQQVQVGATCTVHHTVKAVVQRGSELWLLHSPVWDCYKFAGGGVEPGEKHASTLARELREEAGAELLDLGLTPVWVPLDMATQANAAAQYREGSPHWLRREVAVLRALAGQR